MLRTQLILSLVLSQSFAISVVGHETSDHVYCDSFFDYNEFADHEVLNPGDDENMIFSNGAVVKVSCLFGWELSSPNDTATCDSGKWYPALPQCSPRHCEVPFIKHAVFYEGRKSLYFQELIKHGTEVEVKCQKGYSLAGDEKLKCKYGEWDVQESPECLPAACTLPPLEYGHYLEIDKTIYSLEHGAEVKYFCQENDTNKAPGFATCEFGDWKAKTPSCELNFPERNPNKSTQYFPRRSCTSPAAINGIYVFEGALPLRPNNNSASNFKDGTELNFRCSSVRRKARNQWTVTCKDGLWTGTENIGCSGAGRIVKFLSLPDPNMINASCTFTKHDPNVVTFHKDELIQAESETEFPSGSIITSRCVDIGKFQLVGPLRRKCLSGIWLGMTPRCEGLNQIHDYSLSKPPTILFHHENGTIAQSNEGNLIVSVGTTLHLDCLWIRKYGSPRWETSNRNREYPEGWAGEKGDSYLEYRLTIPNAQEDDSGIFSCVTFARKSHEINVIVRPPTVK